MINNKSYIIRIYDQDLYSDWTDKGGYKIPEKSISAKELVQDLESNGLEIIQSTYSSFGGCYFFEVKGVYKGNIKFQKLDAITGVFSYWA